MLVESTEAVGSGDHPTGEKEQFEITKLLLSIYLGKVLETPP